MTLPEPGLVMGGGATEVSTLLENWGSKPISASGVRRPGERMGRVV
jgi:hypothetical protein